MGGGDGLGLLLRVVEKMICLSVELSIIFVSMCNYTNCVNVKCGKCRKELNNSLSSNLHSLQYY